jgi:hypothetical protein
MKANALMVAIGTMILTVCGCQKSSQPMQPALEHPVVSLYLARDVASRPPREPVNIVLRMASHLRVALINDTDRPFRILWDGRHLRGLRCMLYQADGPVNFHATPDFLPPRLPQDVFTLSPGSEVVDQGPLLCYYELSWLKPGEYALQIWYRAGANLHVPNAIQPAELTPVSVETWVSIKLIR